MNTSDVDEDDFEHTCSITRTYTWDVYRLWELASGLPVKEVSLDDIPVWEDDHWKIDGLNDFLDHIERMLTADLSYPIILAADGSVMDGIHRLAQAKRLGMTTIKVVQFEVDPPCDREE